MRRSHFPLSQRPVFGTPTDHDFKSESARSLSLFSSASSIAARLQRSDLERPLSPRLMRRLVLQFAHDRETYPDEDVHKRVGIVKIILEEYSPLTALAAELNCVRSARLTPMSTEGPDAEIRFWTCRRIGVQITCANQSYGAALQREELRSGKLVFPFQRRRKDKATREVVAEGRILRCPEDVVADRVQRIGKAIERKCIDYRGDTELLLVADESAHWGYLERAGFIGRVHKMFSSLKKVRYDAVYVCFGDVIVSLRDEHRG